MDQLDGRNLVVEEGAWKSGDAVLDVNALGLSVGTFGEITFEGGRAELVGVNLKTTT